MKKKMCVIALCSAMLLSGCGISDEISKGDWNFKVTKKGD